MSQGWKNRRYFRFLLWILLGLLILFSIAYYMGRPTPPRKFEVDVTDKIADCAQSTPSSPVVPSPALLRPSDDVK